MQSVQLNFCLKFPILVIVNAHAIPSQELGVSVTNNFLTKKQHIHL